MSELKTYKRTTVGSIYKAKKEGGSDYFQFRLKDGESLTFNNGDTLQVETKKSKLESIERAVAAGKLGEDKAEEARGRAERMPDFVRAELVLVRK